MACSAVCAEIRSSLKSELRNFNNHSPLFAGMRLRTIPIDIMQSSSGGSQLSLILG